MRPVPPWLEGENNKLQHGDLSAINKDVPRVHHDALEFPDGCVFY
jgi:hypothetical protein